MILSTSVHLLEGEYCLRCRNCEWEEMAEF